MIYVYRYFVWPILKMAFFILRFFNRKMARGWEMRNEMDHGLRPWQRGLSGRRPVWFHCASGEFEYAKPVLELFRNKHPLVPTLVTFFSPSIESAILNSKLVDIGVPLPWDTVQSWREFHDHYQPRALLIARTDTWPEMLYQAKLRGVPSLLFSATLTESSGRSRAFARPISRWIFSMLNEIFCVSANDFKNFDNLGVGARSKIAGDTRFDQVQSRLKNLKALKDEQFLGTNARFIAGSTWPEDEAVLIHSIAASRSPIEWVLVPHEPTDDHLRNLEAQLDRLSISHRRYSNPVRESKVLLIDQVGILAELYGKGKFAFVGGSFRKTVHSVMEPLAAGCLTFVGPKIQNNREAIEFSKLSLRPACDFSPVVICETSEQLRETLEKAFATFNDQASEMIRHEIHLRSNQSQKVADWIDSQLNDQHCE